MRNEYEEIYMTPGFTIKEAVKELKMLEEKRKLNEKSELEFKKSMPQKIDKWIEKGKRILTEDKHEEWIRIVPIKAADLYKGMELDACLDIIEILNNKGSLEEAKELIEIQNHSGMSFQLVLSMVKTFCNRGEEFFDYVK